MQATFEFHIKRSVREQLFSTDSWFKLNGELVIADQRVAQELAVLLQPINPNLQASTLNALGLLHEIEHYLLAFYQQQVAPNLLEQLEAYLQNRLGRNELQKLLEKFCAIFPPTPVFKRKISAKKYLATKTGPLSNRQILIQEILLLWLDYSNPAFEAIKPLMDPEELQSETAFEKTFQLFRDFFRSQPPLPNSELTLVDFLQQPAKKFPHSVQSQLQFIAQAWKPYIGDFLKRVLHTLDFIKEEQKARFDKAAFGPGPTVVPNYSGETEEERFSPDEDWMPHLVLIAKSTYVWLDQLSKKYEQPIRTLDQIPDAELERLARFGITGLWLIGIWERSRASQRIKQKSGNPEALASAYSLFDYVIAQDLGGQEALERLKQRAWRYGIRLATDMVPNHTGIDSRWMIEHPDWFIQLPYSPFPQYRFTGPDLCDHPDIGIFIEDGYWNQSDAAVVFKRLHYPSGEVRYIYHGNDGTSMPWNDTAQLNYLLPQVREAVIQKILEIARQFPIIRFDAAMTLTRKHFQRLWFPEPGTGGDIPSRSQFAMTKEEFEQHMPKEFWREVVDRVQQEAPDTLLLAEAFWLMESYFVRTLGMHRVYNSAFMNMLKNEENDKFRLLIKNTLQFNPQILKRYVNFMNNPDEETAVVQFGKGDKYFGVCVLLATLPGLPMFGHGQIEGFAEKYGMEYKKAYWDEEEDSWFVQEHFRLIAPLLKKRYLFSDVQHFFLFDLINDNHEINENVFAFSNRSGAERALVVYNNSLQPAKGWLNWSTAVKKDNTLIQKQLWEALNLPDDEQALIVFRDHISGLHYIRSLQEFKTKGLFVELQGYQYQVYMDFRIVHHSKEAPYQALCEHLNGRGVANIEIALKEFLYQPLHQAVTTFLDTLFTGLPSTVEVIEQRLKPLLLQTIQFESFSKSPLPKILKQVQNWFQRLMHIAELKPWQAPSAQSWHSHKRLQHFFKFEPAQPSEDLRFYHSFVTYFALNTLYQQNHAAERFEERLLPRLFSKKLDQLNHQKFGNNQGVLLLSVLQLFPKGLPFNKSKEMSEQLHYLFNLSSATQYLHVHSFAGELYFNKEHFEELLFWFVVLYLLNASARSLRSPSFYQKLFKQWDQLTTTALKNNYRVEAFLQAISK